MDTSVREKKTLNYDLKKKRKKHDTEICFKVPKNDRTTKNIRIDMN